MSSKSDIWMPIYIGDLLGDTQHLTNEQFGIYHKLFYHQWRHGHFSEEEMATIAGYAVFEAASSTLQADLKQAFSRVLAPLKELLAKDKNDLLYSRRCDQEKAQWFEKKRVFIERARKGGLAKARRRREEIAASSSASSVLEGMLEPCTSPIEEQEQKQKLPAPTPPAARPPVGMKNKPREQGTSPRQKGTSPRQQGTSPRQRGTSPRQLGTSPRQLGTSPRQVRHRNVNKAKPRREALGARPNGRINGEAHPGHTSARAVPPKAAVAGFNSRSRPAKADPRREGMESEVLAYWKAQNPEGPDLHFGRADDRALDDLLAGNQDLTKAGLKKLLVNRFNSEVNPAALPRKWLRSILEYAAGPLGKYGKLLVPPRVL